MARADKDHRAESADKAISPACNGRFRRASSAVSQALAFSGFPGHKDVILELQRLHGTEGGVGRIFEYVGPGLDGLWRRSAISPVVRRWTGGAQESA